jgi:hypothetical protein
MHNYGANSGLVELYQGSRRKHQQAHSIHMSFIIDVRHWSLSERVKLFFRHNNVAHNSCCMPAVALRAGAFIMEAFVYDARGRATLTQPTDEAWKNLQQLSGLGS